MRTYDKLIATIYAGHASGDLRPCTGSAIAAQGHSVFIGSAAPQEAG